ncbi:MULTISPECIES: hypothetical protein [Rhodococcus]|uniref:hypothetical protein n=1 Tax=Rhodococcus TaxID=1827 RepID=UPI001E3F54DA|nr:hypothetical protein [Rhodococcus sp. AQ5-07]
MRRASTRMKSLRSLIAIGGAAAMAFGLAQTAGTLANPTDAVNSTGAQVATGNFYPTPLTSGPISCWYEAPWYDTITGRRVSISWPPVAGATGYKVVFVRKSDPNYVVRVDNLPASQTSITGITHGDRNLMYARVHTVNGSVISSGYKTSVEITHKDLTSNRTECQGGTGPELANQAWENVSTWNPTTPAPNGANPLSRMQAEAMVPNEPDALETTTTQAPSTSETVDPTTSTEPTSTTEATTTTAPSTTTPAPTTPETTSPETTPSADPKPVLTDTVESGGLTGGWTAGGNKVAVVDANGNELASGRVESGSTLHWYDGQLWIVGATEVYRIMESPQDGTWKFYKDSGQNMPDFA